MLIVTAVSGILVALVVFAYLTAALIFDQELRRSDVFWAGQQAAKTMTEELKKCLAVTDPQANRITFWWRDVDGDSSLEASELITYAVSSESLLEISSSGSRGLANHVRALNFTYDDTTGPKFVAVTLTLSNESGPLTIESSAWIRNE